MIFFSEDELKSYLMPQLSVAWSNWASIVVAISSLSARISCSQEIFRYSDESRDGKTHFNFIFYLVRDLSGPDLLT